MPRKLLGKIRVDAQGILAHSLPPLALSFRPWALLSLTALFLLYQLIDLMEGEDPEEVRGDIVEFAAGVVAGAVASMVFGLP